MLRSFVRNTVTNAIKTKRAIFPVVSRKIAVTPKKALRK
jgi:hypothetical protein